MTVKKKIRDITEEEFETWKNYNCKTYDLHCTGCPFRASGCGFVSGKYSWYIHKEMYSDRFLDQEIEIGVPEILDDAEKEYLSAVIKPFKKRVDYIMKSSNSCCDKEYIFIRLDDDFLSLPFFKVGTMYQGMELERAYTLKELGL